MSFIETDDGVKKYEYAVLVTNLKDEIPAYPNTIETVPTVKTATMNLKTNGGGGYTTQDMKRCRLAARFVALVYNWWTLFVRLAVPDKHHEAKTSRPLLLNAVAKQIKHGGQTKLTITGSHAGRA